MLVAHQQRTIKYVFDETVNWRECWISRREMKTIKEFPLLSQSSQTAKDESKDQGMDGA